MSVTRVKEGGRGVYYEKIKVWKFRPVCWVRNDNTSIEDLKFIRSYYTCRVLPSLNKVFTSFY